MKFGGSSLASPSAVRRVVEILRLEQRRRIVVVSAHGNTTNRLEQILKHAAHAETYLSWKAIKELREYHFSLAEDLLSEQAFAGIDSFLRDAFRDLHVLMLEVCDGERELTAADRAHVLSLGEQLSSRLMAAVLSDAGLSSRHLDARKLVLTDAAFCDARPRYWETYARFRWALAADNDTPVAVIGGFMGATEDGRTTVLGRGGSDLTATIAGAALNAGEIQIWKDVDGMLTCDPRLKPDGLLVKHLSYQDASTLAQAGAKILHPDTIAPAERLRIPVFLRNTFQPRSEGTRIGKYWSAGLKSIVCRAGVMLLEITTRSADADLAALAEELKRQGTGVQVLNSSPERLLLTADKRTDFSAWKAMESGCLQVRVTDAQLLMTLVGAGIAEVTQLLPNAAAIAGGQCCVYAVVNESDCKRCLDLLHAAFFQSVDAKLFARRSAVQPDRGLRPSSYSKRGIFENGEIVLAYEKKTAGLAAFRLN